MANSIDPKQEQRVWSRVMAAQTGSAAEPNACERLSRRDAPVFDGEAALALCTAQLGAACTYRTLAARARGCGRPSERRARLRISRRRRGQSAIRSPGCAACCCAPRSALEQNIQRRSRRMRGCWLPMPRAVHICARSTESQPSRCLRSLPLSAVWTAARPKCSRSAHRHMTSIPYKTLQTVTKNAAKTGETGLLLCNFHKMWFWVGSNLVI